MFEEFPPEEYLRRVAAARGLMQRDRIDALLVTTEVNARYLAGIVNCYWVATMADDIQAALIPADPQDEPALLLPDHLCHGAAQSSWVQDRRAWPQFSGGQQPGPVRTIADTLAEKGLDRARIGMEIGPDARLGMSLPYFHQLREALPHCEFVDCEELLVEVRAVKSPAEIACIRRACEITCEGMRAGLEAVAEGVSELEIGRAVTKRWCEVTDDLSSSRPWFLFVYSSPHRSQWFDCGPTDYRLQKGDYVVLDIGYCYKGYWGDMFRTACIGPPDASLERFYRANRLANLAAMEQIAAGVEARQVALAAVEEWRRLGLETQVREQLVDHDYDFVGHGGGLSLHDQPLINTQQDRQLEAGMYLMIEGMLTDHMPFDRAQVCVGIEDGVLVTDSGCERLTASVPDELFIK